MNLQEFLELAVNREVRAYRLGMFVAQLKMLPCNPYLPKTNEWFWWFRGCIDAQKNLLGRANK